MVSGPARHCDNLAAQPGERDNLVERKERDNLQFFLGGQNFRFAPFARAPSVTQTTHAPTSRSIHTIIVPLLTSAELGRVPRRLPRLSACGWTAKSKAPFFFAGLRPTKKAPARTPHPASLIICRSFAPALIIWWTPLLASENLVMNNLKIRPERDNLFNVGEPVF